MPWLWCQNSVAYFGNTLGLVVEPWCWSDINWFEQWIKMSYEIYLYWLHVAKESIPYSKVKWRMTLIVSRSWVTSQVTRAIARFHCSIYSCPGGGQQQHASLSWYHHPTTDEAALPLAPAGFHHPTSDETTHGFLVPVMKHTCVPIAWLMLLPVCTSCLLLILTNNTPTTPTDLGILFHED